MNTLSDRCGKLLNSDDGRSPRLRAGLRWRPLLVIGLLWALSPPCVAQDGPPEQDDASVIAAAVDAAAGTAVDPGIAVNQLRILVKPLTLEEVEREAQEWLKILYEQARQIARKQLTAQGEEGDANFDPDAKTQALAELTDMKLAQTKLMERIEVVLDSMKAKGGDTTKLEAYVAAQRGVTLDTSDTEATWAAIRGWLKSEEGGLKWFWKLVNFFVILAVSMVLTGLISRLVNRWLKTSSRLSQLAGDLIARSIRNVLLLLGVLVAITALGVDVAPLLAAMGATGFIIGFALQGTLSNFASGMMILLNRPFDVGDVVKAGGVSGTVSAMNLVSTTFLTFDNQKIIVPNNEIWDNVITNVTARDTRRVDLVFRVGYEDDLRKVESILQDVVQNHPLVLTDPAATIKVHELADSSVNFICRPWARSEDYWPVYWDVIRGVKERFEAAGVTTPYPRRKVHLQEPTS
ncbi:MAG: mechanosensitive ion channel family protein [Planctomycetaceae bacterium]|nr:mechanosensitive ion channel family protein [Planctomycetaceae bacterium]